MGDDYWTPEILLSTWYQAETGKIPVSGAGYGGPFSGEGFDSIWTDMSEIVRPTRDGIHGREYISTAIDLGRHPMFLAFDDQGDLAFEPPPLLEIPLPVLLWRSRPWGRGSPGSSQTTLRGRKSLGTLTVVTRKPHHPEAGPSRRAPGAAATPPTPWNLDDPLLLKEVRLVEILDSRRRVDQSRQLKHRHPQVLRLDQGARRTAGPPNRAAALAGGRRRDHPPGRPRQARGMGTPATCT